MPDRKKKTTTRPMNHKSDVLVIGSGLAGMAMALKLADKGQIILLSKEAAPETNSAMAQGGIAAVMSKEDSFEDHVRDTLIAGAGLCKENIVRNTVEQAPDRIQDLINWGVEFDENLTREGGHSFRRILHFEDQTGFHIHQALLKKVRQHPNIKLMENYQAIDLIINKQVDPTDMGPVKCVGCYALNKTSSNVESFTAATTVLATGGAGKVYLYTSNWSGATGDGIAMAYRVGARIANLEFMQFHPTCLFHRDSRNFLISEALRGEGGELVTADGVAFMKKYHPLGSLAPRDIVARSIDAEMKKSGAPCVFLKMTHLDPEFVKSHFPTIYAKCLEYGIDITTQPIPVVPAAHYLCGGILVDQNGQTDVPQLFAIGENACTGLHGANRLASNSLLECLVTAHNAAKVILANWQNSFATEKEPPAWIIPKQTNDDEMIVINHMWDEIRRLMWNYVGIVRTNKRLLRAQSRLKNILAEVKEYYSGMKLHSDIIELRNIAIVAELSVECALKRHESRGIHYNLDYPFALENQDSESQKIGQDTILVRGLR